MSAGDTRYWGFRVSKHHLKFLGEELAAGHLRQGWGYDAGQDLRHPENLDPGARRNLRMYEEVKRGHILLVPRLPQWHLVAVVEATEDWDRGYRFEIPATIGDFGHIFPAKLLKWFPRDAAEVTGDLRASLRNPARFWNMDGRGRDIETLRGTEQDALDQAITDDTRLSEAVQSAFDKAFDEGEFGKAVYERLNKEFEGKRWELVLERVLRTRYPAPCQVEQVGGRGEERHGTDILILLPGVGVGPRYAIAVQIKDWEGTVSARVIDQIGKATWWEEEGHQVIEKVVVMTKAEQKDNAALEAAAKCHGVRLVFAEQLRELLTDHAKHTVGLGSSD